MYSPGALRYMNRCAVVRAKLESLEHGALEDAAMFVESVANELGYSYDELTGYWHDPDGDMVEDPLNAVYFGSVDEEILSELEEYLEIEEW